jgi:hypothetical protein
MAVDEPIEVCLRGDVGKVLGVCGTQTWHVQKMQGKINYLWCFISNVAGTVESFLPLVRLKHEQEFAWGAEQQ